MLFDAKRIVCPIKYNAASTVIKKLTPLRRALENIFRPIKIFVQLNAEFLLKNMVHSS